MRASHPSLFQIPGKTYYKMTVSKKIKIEQNKVHYNLDRHTAKILALSSENVGKYGFLTGKDVSPEKDLLEKTASIERSEYSPLGSELKKETDIAGKQYKN